MKISLFRMFDDTNGRYVVAQKSIAKNEKIFSEKPFAFIPVHNYGIKKYFNSDCENCGLVNVWPFLCLDCRMASYCSPKCCEEHQRIHKYECQGYKVNLWFEIGIAHLSVRCLLVGFPSLIKKLQTFSVSEFKNKPEKIFQRIIQICNEKYRNYFDSDGGDDFQHYARVIGLLPNLFRDGTFSLKNSPYALVSLIYLFRRFIDSISSFSDCPNAHHLSP
jgi:hypothetical protein